jgi:hypothetical protein
MPDDRPLGRLVTEVVGSGHTSAEDVTRARAADRLAAMEAFSP